MELNGFSRAIIAPEDDNGKFKEIKEFKNYGKYKDLGLFQVDLQTSKGTTQSNISGMNPTVTAVYGSNTKAESETGSENPSIAFGANDLPWDIGSILKGMHYDETNGGYKRNDKSIFYGAYVAVSENHGFPVYYSFPFCTFTAGSSENMGTDTQNAVTTHDTLTITPQARPSDNLLYQIFIGDTTRDKNWKDEMTMLKYIVEGLGDTSASTPVSNS